MFEKKYFKIFILVTQMYAELRLQEMDPALKTHSGAGNGRFRNLNGVNVPGSADR